VVQAGASRKVDVYGVYPNADSCGGTSSIVDLFYMGTKTVDLNDNAAVTIPITYSATSVATCTRGGPPTLLPNQAYRDNSGSCALNGVNSGANSSSVTASDGDVRAIDGVSSFEKCARSAGTQYMAVDFYYSASGIDSPSTITVTWRGRAGKHTSAAYTTAGTAFSGAGGTVYIYTGASTWQAVGGATTGTAAGVFETITGSVPFTAGMNFSGNIIVRVGGGAAGSGEDSTVDTDYIAITLQ
jgi:hypothetical protein